MYPFPVVSQSFSTCMTFPSFPFHIASISQQPLLGRSRDGPISHYSTVLTPRVKAALLCWPSAVAIDHSHTMFLTNTIDTNGPVSKNAYILLHHGDERKLVAAPRTYQVSLPSYHARARNSFNFERISKVL